MANFVLQVPITLRSFTVSASSNPNGAALSGGSGSNSGVGPVILELPLDKIRRPLMRTRSNDPIKVQELMDSISQIGLQVPVSLVVTGMRLTNDLDSPPYAAKYGVVQKRL
ncbi:sulfiredoxin, chloroplastic/mitochondrial isoform X3 [Trifolium pratense]|uniref:sulfiredoxin, chloroplastic/mitochondrial isoform X3 n=1 Tax=Trifolium pratense TaxID=57577 RepID=UPI001E691621|nr:sulfiredoxin, chloroplastic/mitochondrial isoform X3 [Trifolium pratense]